MQRKDYCELNDEGKTAFGMAITALELFGNSEQLPSAQPEQTGCEYCQGLKGGNENGQGVSYSMNNEELMNKEKEMLLDDLIQLVGCHRVFIKTDSRIMFKGTTNFILDNRIYFEDCLYRKVRSIDPAFDTIRQEPYLVILVSD